VFFLLNPNPLAASFVYIFESYNKIYLVVPGINNTADIIFQCVGNKQSEMDYFQSKQIELLSGFSKYYLDISSSIRHGIKVCKRIQQSGENDPVLYFKKIKHM
jgi:hypothetical protein